MAVAYSHASGSQNGSNGTSLTWAHDCTGDNYLLVSVNHRLNPGTESVTYNGVAMTQLKLQSASFNWQGLYGLANPDTGTNNIVASWANNVNVGAVGISVTGYGSSGTIANAAVAGGVTAYGPTDTLTADDLYVGFSGVPDVPTQISMTTGTERAEAGTGTDASVNGGTNSGSGSVSVQWTYLSVSDPKTYIAIPLIAGATGTTRDARLLTLLGVG